MKVQVYKREDGRWDWRLIAANGRIIATSGGQGYTAANKAWTAYDNVAADMDWVFTFPRLLKRETVR